MNLSENLNESFSFLSKAFDDLGNLILLIVFWIIPIADIVALGYYADIVRRGRMIEVPPKFENFGKLFVDGLKVFVASLIYAIVPLLIMLAGMMPMITGTSFLYGGSNMFLIFFGTYMILAMVLLFIFMLVGIVAIGYMIRTGEFGKIFAFGEIFDIIKRIGWGSYLLWYIVISVIGYICASIPYVGMVLLAIYELFASRSLALLLDEAGVVPSSG